MKKTILLLLILTMQLQIVGQEKISDHAVLFSSLNTKELEDFFKKKIENTQFIMLGEQHGIKEAGQVTNTLYDMAKPQGYNALCIEVSPFAANMLDLQFTGSKNPEDGLRKLYNEYPFTIPFYNNVNDIELFKNVIANKGEIWGIDQVFMAEFRLVFDYIVNLSANEELKKAVEPLLKEAKIGFEKAVKEKNMMAPFIFKYSDELHNSLLQLAKTEDEKKILKDLKLTKDIYSYNFQKQFYKNNNERAKLMKRNFLEYYDSASDIGELPKVIFKLGANHVAKGLNNTNVLDISNMVTELATINGTTSLHIYAMGVNGTKNLGNPFAPVSVVPFDNSKDLPDEVQEILKTKTEKYLIIDAEALRNKANSISAKMKKLVLKYDVLIYIRDCEALEGFD